MIDRRPRTTDIFRFIVLLLIAMAAQLVLPAMSLAQDETLEDTVRVLSQPGREEYECCHTFVVTNRHSADTKITEFRVRVISGTARFIPGQAGSPPNWSVFIGDDLREATWIPGTNDAEIDSGESVTSFRVCLRDTGIYRLVWETRDFTGVLSTDTLTLVCSGQTGCDEVFFRGVASGIRCGFDLDLFNANNQQQFLNDFHIKVLTPGVTLDTVGTRAPAGWRVRGLTGDSIAWTTTTNSLRAGDFIENFRLFMNTNGRVDVKIRWWTTNFGNVICSDTMTMLCGLSVIDSLFLRADPGAPDSCCREFLLINTHVPRTPIRQFRLTMNTANADFRTPPAPEGWEVTVNATRDTIIFTSDSVLSPHDTAVFSDICFENTSAADDTVRYSWRTIDPDNVPINGGTIRVTCFRPLIGCDSIALRVDSTIGGIERCVTFDVSNRNSRGDVVRGVAFAFSNPGRARRIVRTQPAQGWSVEYLESDSVFFGGGTVQPGRDRPGFTVCLSTGDTNMRDPLTVVWTTFTDGGRVLCRDTILVNFNIVRTCDTVRAVENVESIDPLCCYDITFYNVNDRARPINQIRVRVPRTDLIVDTAMADAPWQVLNESFPSVDAVYGSSTLLAGDSVTFRFCVNAFAQPTRPFSFPIIWQTLSQGQIVCFDTLQVVCEGGTGVCDTAFKVSVNAPDERTCRTGYRIVNRHLPSGGIDNVRIALRSQSGAITRAYTLGDATAFSQVTASASEAVFEGSTIPSGSSIEQFVIEFAADSGQKLALEVCTFEGGIGVCCIPDTVQCLTSDVLRDEEMSGVLGMDLVPNPTIGEAAVEFTLERPSTVRLSIVDARGVTVRAFDPHDREAGAQSIRVDLNDLPVGIYHVVLETGGGKVVRKIILQ